MPVSSNTGWPLSPKCSLFVQLCAHLLDFILLGYLCNLSCQKCSLRQGIDYEEQNPHDLFKGFLGTDYDNFSIDRTNVQNHNLFAIFPWRAKTFPTERMFKIIILFAVFPSTLRAIWEAILEDYGMVFMGPTRNIKGMVVLAVVALLDLANA